MKPNPYKRDPYEFQTNPRQGWKETADFIRQQRGTKKRPTTSLHDRLLVIEQQLKDKQ